MTLKEWFHQRKRGEKAAMSASLGISRTWTALIIAGSHKPSPELAMAIEAYTAGEVSRADLRPDLWG